MKNLTKTEQVRRYATKHPFMTVRQMASDLDMSPASVHQIMWNLRKKGKLGGPEAHAPNIEMEVKSQPVSKEPNELKTLKDKIAEQRVIIRYLEKRVAEATNERN